MGGGVGGRGGCPAGGEERGAGGRRGKRGAGEPGGSDGRGHEHQGRGQGLRGAQAGGRGRVREGARGRAAPRPPPPPPPERCAPGGPRPAPRGEGGPPRPRPPRRPVRAGRPAWKRACMAGPMGRAAGAGSAVGGADASPRGCPAPTRLLRRFASPPPGPAEVPRRACFPGLGGSRGEDRGRGGRGGGGAFRGARGR